MKRSYYFLASIILVSTAIIISCSDDKEVTPSTEIATKSLTEVSKSEVPRDRIFYSSLDKVQNASLYELIQLYKKDVGTAEKDYSTNLKNMWFAVLKNKLAAEGTEEQKLFFIHEQISLPDNLAFFTDFYNMLAASKLLDRAGKEEMAAAFYEKNLKAINEVQWHTPAEQKNKKTELVYAQSIFHKLVASQK